MKKICYIVIGILLVLALSPLPIIVSASPQTSAPQAGGTIRAHTVAFTHHAEGQDHFGAYFSGKEGYWQHYRGFGGDAITAPFSGGIANWGWWGTFYHVLAVPKTFLYLYPPAWTGNNYEATFIVIW